ncbi:D-alanyl-D-alanine carboxypeptidase/D-alanyl-D-alanine endopeptidase [Limisphaera sp. VF-2]|jgi:D-alanyl-D-alanine carboxypeptidase/D-alanyl-D-alanine-endopeptidase (penicillin-binding protein 4)|uniref:D-alanyl-D-alanine carboxypeptidase/D-alanyl-D-alanine endopeptidase n=1 Tax=Limisphaera sp. VF-2 TaxID=3400418 RepID=UPI00176EC602|nr:D-alanyl-D-alanine carboxypeptidase/D-alanyl-D-alanine-endopeptidase [Limisphaera sp.]
MKRFARIGPTVYLGLLLACGIPHPAAPQTTNRITPAKPPKAELVEKLRARLADPRFAHAQWGVCVQRLDSGTTVFEHNANQLFSPASITKLFTAALALDRLGPAHRFSTILRCERARLAQGVLAGPLIVEGHGDPGFVWEEEAPNPLRSFQPLVEILREAGIRELCGGIVAVDGFDRASSPAGGPRFGPGWTWEDLIHGYGAALSGLMANEGKVRVRVRPGAGPGKPCDIRLHPVSGGLQIQNATRTVDLGGPRKIALRRMAGRPTLHVTGCLPSDDPGWETDVAVPDPAYLFLELFRQALEQEGIRVAGPLDVHRDPLSTHHVVPDAELVELGRTESAPLEALVRTMLKDSRNVHAALLWTAVGLKCEGSQARPGSTPDEVAQAQLSRFLTTLGIPADEVHLEEGSGLSRNNLVTPRAVVALLRAMRRHPAGKTFESGLPVAGVDGTLAGRMKGSPAEGRVRAKTGTLRWAHGLAGYVNPPTGSPLVFCLLLNRYTSGPSDPSPPAELDALAECLVEISSDSIP